jgi:hypothetical protein
MSEKETFPSWRYGPDGAAAVFQSADEVPEGWQDHPSLVPDEPGNAEGLTGINDARALYRAKFKKNPGPRWDEATIRAKLED